MKNTLIASIIASIVSYCLGLYMGYKVANDDLQEYIQASLNAYTATEQLNKEAMKTLEQEKDKVISNLISSMDSMRDVQRNIRESSDRVFNSTRSSSDNRDTTTNDPCGSLRETLRERSELLGRCSKLLERGSGERSEEALKHDALVDIITSYQKNQNKQSNKEE